MEGLSVARLLLGWSLILVILFSRSKIRPKVYIICLRQRSANSSSGSLEDMDAGSPVATPPLA